MTGGKYVLLYFLFAIISSCEHSQSNQELNDAKIKSNFIFTGDFYNDEMVELYFNDSFLFKERIMADSIKLLKEYFLVNYGIPFTISLKTFYNDQVYLDTTIIITNKKSEIRYKLVVTHPHPYDWQKYYKNGVPDRKWGYLPIDSSIRFVHLVKY